MSFSTVSELDKLSNSNNNNNNNNNSSSGSSSSSSGSNSSSSSRTYNAINRSFFDFISCKSSSSCNNSSNVKFGLSIISLIELYSNNNGSISSNNDGSISISISSTFHIVYHSLTIYHHGLMIQTCYYSFSYYRINSSTN